MNDVADSRHVPKGILIFYMAVTYSSTGLESQSSVSERFDSDDGDVWSVVILCGILNRNNIY